MSESKHTPTPWHVLPMSYRVQGPAKELVADCRGLKEAEANAAFIVTACNAHEELVAALKAAVDATQPQKVGLPFLRAGDGCTEVCQAYEEPDWVATARAALAKVSK